MMVFNTCISDNLVNGAFGTIVDIITSEKTGEIDFIIIDFDNPVTGIQQRIEFKSIAEKYVEQNGKLLRNVDIRDIYLLLKYNYMLKINRGKLNHCRL